MAHYDIETECEKCGAEISIHPCAVERREICRDCANPSAKENDMSNVIDFHGVTTQDIDVDKVLDGSKDLDDVLVLGYRDGEFVMASSRAEIGEVLIKLEHARNACMRSLEYWVPA